ncbi:hypothetical protein [Metabacillus fastidiosus]|uniref:hypothetical protein n=1 Tax=Metabacillus fastidiosus TaxID=1458 RepID=UPI003D29E107
MNFILIWGEKYKNKRKNTENDITNIKKDANTMEEKNSLTRRYSRKAAPYYSESIIPLD